MNRRLIPLQCKYLAMGRIQEAVVRNLRRSAVALIIIYVTEAGPVHILLVECIIRIAFSYRHNNYQASSIKCHMSSLATHFAWTAYNIGPAYEGFLSGVNTSCQDN